MNPNKNSGESLRGVIYTALSAVLFGTMALMARYAFSLGSNPLTVVAGRFFTGAVVTGILLLIRDPGAFKVGKRAFIEILLLSVAFAITPILLYSSYQYVGAGLATTLHFIYPLVVMLLEALFFRAGITGKSLVCAALCMVGILLFSQPGSGADMRGLLLAAASGVTFAIYVVGLGKSHLKQQSVTAVTFYLSLLSTVEVAGFAALMGELRLDLPARVWLAYLGLGLVAMVFATSLFQLGVTLCGSVKASLLSTLEPVTGIVVGILFLNERLTIRTALGMIFVLSAVVLLALPERRPSPGNTHQEDE